MADARLPARRPRLDDDEVEPERQPRDAARRRAARRGRAGRRRRRAPACACGGRPSPRAARSLAPARQRTSTTTSAGGGPGSTATRSSSWRPTWTFRARIVQPAAGQPGGDERLGGVARLLRRGPSRVRRPVDPCRHRGGRRSTAASPAVRASGRRALQGGQVERVERRVVGHDRDQLALEQVVRLRRRGRVRRAGRGRAGRRRASAGARGTSAGGTASGRARRIAVAVLERRVALVVLPAVARVARGEARHHPVADDLGHDRRAGDRVDLGVAVDDRSCTARRAPRTRRSGCRRPGRARGRRPGRSPGASRGGWRGRC